MTKWARVAIVSTLAAAAAVIASRPADAQGLGYGIAGPAGYTGFFGSSAMPMLHAAGGGEFLVGGRVGAGGEFGLMANSNGGVFGTSANGVFHFTPSEPTPIRRRISPFASGGYSRITSGEGGFDAFNLGAGADVWLKPRVGMRFEVRDHIRPDTRGGVQYFAFRVGVVFR